ncbi:mycolipanoate synthase [Penicillium ochrochloron]
MQWPESRLERASVNCFGIGGANAHVVLDSTASYYGNDFCHESLGKQIPSSKPRLLVVSAKAPEALQERIQKMTDYVNNDLPRLADVAFTLGERREHMQYRAFAVASANKPVDASLFHTGQAKAHPELSFIFTGQGAQWPGMGKDLIDKYEVFRKEIEDLDNTLQSLVEPPMWSLKGTSPDIRSTGVIDPSLSTEELAKSGGTSRVDNAELSQPLCTALQIGLVNLLRHMGVQPSCTVGHSSGEIAAAYAAGALSAKSAMALAYYRGKVTATQEGKGAMLAVGVSRDKISPYLKDGVVLACENSPESVTLSGDIEVIRDLTLRIKRDFPDTLCRPLRVKTAYHSLTLMRDIAADHMQGLGKSYESYISSYLEHNDNMLPMFSSVVVSRIDEPKLLGAKYWKENLQRPVLFSQAIGAILAQDHPNHHFLEIGPHCALAGPLRQIFQSAAPKRLPTYTPTLTRFVGDSQSQILHTLGSVHATGIKIDFAAANGCGKTLTNLPSYPWQHKKYWNESRLTSEWRHRQFPHHELLGARTAESCALEPSWRNLLRVEDVPWIWDHVLQSNIVFPGAGYIAMAGEAIRQLLPDVDDYSVRNVVFKAPLMLKADQVVEMLTTLGPVSLTDLVDSEWYKFTIMANEGGNWIKHCQGQVRSQYDFPPAVQSAKSYIRNVDSEHWYQALACMGLSYGKAFQGLDKITAHPVNMEAQATVSSNNSHCSARYTLHPTNIDQCLQLMSVAMTNGISRHIDRIAIPAAIGSVYVAGTKPEMTLGADMVRNSTGTLVGNSVASVDDRVLLSLSQASFFTVPVPLSSDCNAPLHSEIKWVPDVNLTCLASWLPPPHISGEAYESSKAGGIMVLLFILETAHRLAPITPAESHMRRFKAWLDKETSKIASGYYTSIPESKNWAPMSSDERECIVLDIESRHQDGVATSWISCARKVLNNCVALAKGTRSGVEILLEGDSLDKLYETSTSIGSWKEAMQLLGANNPTMKILEIGAGTGGATRKVLSDLVSPEGVRLYSKYVFTDISPGFTVSAQEKFANYQNLEFKVLDISRDPAEQGFELHEFDMIVASNVSLPSSILQPLLLFIISQCVSY